MTKKMDLVETLHGIRVADPYRWLENADADDVRAWTDEQNAHTREQLEAFGGRDALKGQIGELLRIGHVTAPSIRTLADGGRRYFHTRREGTQNQPILHVRDGVSGQDRVLIDASTLSEDGTTALDWWYPSRDGARLAWGRSESGSEESTLFLRDVTTGQDLPDRIPHTRHASVAWLPDGGTFYYSRFPEPGSVPPGDEKYFSKIYRHVVGDDPEDDALVFPDPRDPRERTDTPSVVASPDGRWLVVRVHQGWDRSEVWIKDLHGTDPAAPTGWVAVAKDAHAVFEPIPRNDRLYLQTNDGAPRYTLHAVDYHRPERAAWTQILPEQADVLDDVAVLANEIVATYLHEASTRIERFALDGTSNGPIALPGIGSASVTGAPDGEEVFVAFTSYVVPAQVHRLDLRQSAAQLEPWAKVGARFQSDGIEVERLSAVSKDGTLVPMFVISKKGTKRDGQSPLMLYGYGGFNVNQTPGFSARALASVNRGAVWVTAILRGGGELGEEWHRAGMLERKQNTFDDFIACAETLIREKLTTSDRLGIIGGSNGGLLVAAAITQRPDLFRAGLSLVPLTDMLRYHRFRIARLWIPEYGDPDQASDFAFLHAYSPYHRVQEGVRYPAMLFTTAESDSRVDPMHARKMAARLQDVQKDASRPILLRVETKAGHGAGKPITKLAEELADELTFLFHELGVGPATPKEH